MGGDKVHRSDSIAGSLWISLDHDHGVKASIRPVQIPI